MKTMGFLAVCGALGLLAWGCGDDGARMVDSGPMIELDAGPGTDSGPGVDGGPDAGRDAGDPGGCELVGIGCTPDRGCRSGECQARIDYMYGGAADPVTDHPMGEDTVEAGFYFGGGYCTPSPISFVDSGGCDPDVEGSCGECAECLFLGQQTGRDLSMCFKTCTASMTEQTCPQADLQCLLGSDVCLWGCVSDAECAIYRPDTNGNGEIDAYDAAMNPGGDNLVYDLTGNHTCNTTTRRCEHDGTAGAFGGSVCVRDSDCEANARCLDEAGTDGAWPGGYCIKNGCNVVGNECAAGGVCDSRAFGADVCLAPCTVASPMTAGDVFSNNADCRTGYACFWDGVSGATADNGVCIPGNYNAVRTANIGADCRDTGGVVDEALCYSPYGLGQCRDWDGAEGPGIPYCTIFDCGAPGVDDTTVCGAGGVCAGVMGSVTTLCLQTCTSADECGAGYGCWDTTAAGITTGGARVCFSGCLMDTDCRTGQTCVGATMTMLGECT